MPAIAAPTIGASQNSQSCCRAMPPTNSAGPVERAGLTDVLVTGIEIRWIRVRARPMAIGAKPGGYRLVVAPRMIIRNMKVSTSSMINADVMLNLPGDASP